jgi:hypothetical protein
MVCVATPRIAADLALSPTDMTGAVAYRSNPTLSRLQVVAVAQGSESTTGLWFRRSREARLLGRRGQC